MLMMPGSYLQTRRKFDPRQISDLGLWLDASDASTITIATGVSAWNDKSGNGRNFAQATGASQPEQISAGQNGRNTIRGNGTSHVMTMGSGLNLFRNVIGGSIFVVRKWVTSPAASANCFIVERNGSGFGRAFVAAGHTANKATAGGRRTDSDSTVTVASSSSVGAGHELQVALFDWANSDLYQYINGTLDGSSTSFQTDGSTADTDSAGVGIFAHTAPGGYGNVEVAELAVWPSLVTTTQRHAVEGYLAHKWGLASSLPSTHPYRFAAP
jgi:hypothetical protein